MNEEDKVALQIPISDLDHLAGPAQASVVVVSYGDYECPDCHRRHHDVQKLIDELKDSVRFVYRHFPLVRIHPNALRAAEAAEVAAAQDKFWEMHRLLYTHPEKLGDRQLRHYAREIGLDLDRFDRDLAGGTYKERILKDYYQSINFGITGAPTTFVNGLLFSMSGVELMTTVKSILHQEGKA